MGPDPGGLGPKPDLGGKAADGVPGVRGVLKLAEAMAVIPLVKRALPEARLPMRICRPSARWAPRARRPSDPRERATRPLGNRTRAGGMGREAAVALVSLAPALLALRGGELAAYHGVEHKSIAAYEDGEAAAEAAKEHDRCGSHLVAPMLAAAAVGSVAARRAGLRGPAAEVAVGVGSARSPSRCSPGRAPPEFSVDPSVAPSRPRDPACGGHPRAHAAAARGG